MTLMKVKKGALVDFYTNVPVNDFFIETRQSKTQNGPLANKHKIQIPEEFMRIVDVEFTPRALDSPQSTKFNNKFAPKFID